ncbi:hypothetical protein QR680_005197 [Steinernema hermaphroditum]|uniref:VWFA domain-containing protein n=1 Tax=Steinernema hermaphroditum TaxID=289476 RepID=A0AA39HTD3_9BILA|nr:hypothetical protein QR680_005197 [Steinernema hermaphroditum]
MRSLHGVAVLFLLPSILACTDFVFVIDGASKGFQGDTDLLICLVDGIDVSPRGHRLALVEYGAQSAKASKWPKFLFKHIKSSPQAVSALRRFPRFEGPSDATGVLEIIANEVLPLRQSPEVPFVIVHLSDGRFNGSDPRIANLSALLARQANVYVFSAASARDVDVNALAAFSGGNRSRVVVGGDVHGKMLNALRQFLKCEAVEETPRRKPKVNSFVDSAISRTTPRTTKASSTSKGPKADEKKATQKDLKNKFYFNSTTTTTPKSTTTTTTTTPKPYTGKPGCQSDIVLLLDLSGGVRDKRDVYVRLATELVKALKIGPFDTQVGVVRFSGPGRTESQFHLNKHAELEPMLQEIESIEAMGGTTRTGEALLFAAEEFAEKYNARPKADRSVVVFTDGHSQDDPTEPARALQRKGVHVYAVAVEDTEVDPDTEQLLTIASDKQSFFFAKEFSHLKDKLVRRNC